MLKIVLINLLGLIFVSVGFSKSPNFSSFGSVVHVRTVLLGVHQSDGFVLTERKNKSDRAFFIAQIQGGIVRHEKLFVQTAYESLLKETDRVRTFLNSKAQIAFRNCSNVISITDQQPEGFAYCYDKIDKESKIKIKKLLQRFSELAVTGP